MIGGVFAGLTAIHLYGDHAKWIDPLMPWGDKHHDKSVSMHNQVCGATTHSLSHPVAHSLARSLTDSPTDHWHSLGLNNTAMHYTQWLYL